MSRSIASSAISERGGGKECETCDSLGVGGRRNTKKRGTGCDFAIKVTKFGYSNGMFTFVLLSSCRVSITE
jgi:hypothetical protein